MKRRLSLLACLLIVIVMAVSLTSCQWIYDFWNGPHTHAHTSEVTTKATCTEAGVMTYTCECGDSYTEVIEAKGHTEVKDEIVLPTCTTTGLTEGKHCSECGLVFVHQNTLAPVEHPWIEGVKTAPTCETKGSITYSCTAEGCDATKTVEIAAIGHDWNEGVVINPTCTAAGYTTYTCKNDASHTKIEAGEAATGHSYDDGVVTTAPTCEGKGVKTFTCTNGTCGHTYTEDVVATGHNYDNGVITTAPTCEGKGVKTFTCANDASHTYTEDVAANGHTPADAVVENRVEASCTIAGSYQEVVYCSVCKTHEISRTNKSIPLADHIPGEPVVENRFESTCVVAGSYNSVVYCSVCKTHVISKTPVALELADHKYNENAWGYTGEDGHSHTCSVCGDKKEIIAHTPNIEAATEEVAKFCIHCDYIIEKEKDHVHIYNILKSDDTYHWYECRCNDVDYTTKASHRGGSATCTTKAVCEKCETGYSTLAPCYDDDKDHNCDYGCNRGVGTCEDKNTDHVCDYGCDKVWGTCADGDKNHTCDYGCGKSYGDHVDGNKDHTCDYGCSEAIGTCEDADKDHACDHGCGKTYGDHVDADKDHVCDYGCKETIGTCEDADKDHDCDHGCDKYFGTCEDADMDHDCDYGCDKTFGTCEDADKDHACDYSGCKEVYGTCEDADKDHDCDYGCGKSYGDHIDEIKDHICDYGCKESIEDHVDNEGDGDHLCEWCNQTASKCAGGTATCQSAPVCTECNQSYGEKNPNAHNWNEGQVTTAPTCSAEGVKTLTCQTEGCGETKTEAVDKAAHVDATGDDFKCDYNCGTTVLPAADTTLTIPEANILGGLQAENSYTADKYYVEGIITSFKESTSYGNFYIKDFNGNEFYVYGIDGFTSLTTKPVVGDTVKLYGIIGNYYSTPQMKSAELISHTIHGECEYEDGVCKYCGDSEPVAGATNVVVSIADYASENGWTNGTQYLSLDINDLITVTTTKGTYTGKYYSDGNNWRMYQNESPSIVVSANDGVTIISVRITYTIDKTGVLMQGSNQIASGDVVAVNGRSITFGVGNTGTVTNGQVRITAIEVNYTVEEHVCAENSVRVDEIPATCTEAGVSEGTKCSKCGTILSGCESIDAKGHDYTDTPATCTTSAKCACGAVNGNPLGHNFVNGVCTNDGCEQTEDATVESMPTTKYVFSSYTAGTQYAEGEEHTLDSNTTLIINGAHLNTQVRLYAGSNAVIECSKAIETITVKAGYKAATLTVYVSDDGSTWTKVQAITTTTSYTNYTVALGGSYQYIKLESTGGQIRVSELTLNP